MIHSFLEGITKNIALQRGQTNVGVLFTAPPCNCANSDKTCNTIDVYLIDSGGNLVDAQRLYDNIVQYAKQNFASTPIIKAIFVTHSHADHCAGNAWLAKKTGCHIYCSKKEKAGLENSFLEPSIFCGCVPVPELLNDYYLVPVCRVSKIIKNKDIFDFINIKVDVIDLPGHYLEPLGFLCLDKEQNKSVFFLGDSIFGRKNIAKYWIPYIYDIQGFLDTLNKISFIKADFYVPSHGDTEQNIDALCELNSLAILETQNAILRMLATEQTFESLLQKIADLNGLCMTRGQYILISSTIRSFLSCLYSQKKITTQIKNNVLYYALA